MRSVCTMLALILLIVSAIALRQRWPRLSRSARVACLLTAVLLMLTRSLCDAVRWEIAYSRINDLLIWGRIVGYVVLVVLFTRLRPRALTIAAAVVLLLPLLSASVYLPLELVFDPTPRRLTDIGDRVMLEQTSWRRAGNDNRAVDYVLSQRSRRLPFLQHTFQVGRIYRTQCDTDHLSAFFTRRGDVILHCPGGEPGDPPLDEEIPLYEYRRPHPEAVVPSNP